MENKLRRRKFNKHQNRGDANNRLKMITKYMYNTNVTTISFWAKIIGFLLACYFLYNVSDNLYSVKTWLKIDNAFVPFNQIFPLNNLYDDYHWSSLASGHYFGLKSARPNSTILSVMWFKNVIEDDTIKIRHWCNDNDHLDKYIWTFNDLHTAGQQTIIDRKLNINTSYIRVNSNTLKAKILLEDTNKKANVATSVILYVAAESFEDQLELVPPSSSESQENKILRIKVNSQTSGKYMANFRVTKGKPLTYSFFHANVPLDKLTETVLNNLFIYRHKEKQYFILRNENDDDLKNYNANFLAYQVVFEESLEIELDMFFNDFTSVPNDFDYDQELSSKEIAFEKKFVKKFFPAKNMPADKVTFARQVLSNVIGGISYFYGYSLVQSPKQSRAMRYGPVQLLTAIPSRPFFPRGFLWDEGFHQLLLSYWDPQLSMLIIKSWFNLMNKDGWIPREVILDDESRARVPGDFLVQHTNIANPPSLFLAIESLIDTNQTDLNWLQEIYPRLDSWFIFYNTTQTGKHLTTFRWQGRNDTTELELNPKTLSSGLDDYPRASHPTRDEIHLDLRCWIAMASRVMAKISHLLSKPRYVEYQRFFNILNDNKLLESWHWSDEHGMFCDHGLHSNDVKLEEVNVASYGEPIMAVRRKVITPPKYQCVNEFGYVSLFPFMMTLIEPDSDKLMKILKDIEDPNLLWTPYGLRSLAKNSVYYNRYNTPTDPPYWRGSIWINMNFMVLKGLNHYRHIVGPYQTQADQLYVRLRNNLIENMYKQYQRTGYVWEQYSDRNGEGKGTRPFTGWSALIVNIMGEIY